MATFAQLKANLQDALDKANTKTGATDTNITDCIERLIASSGSSSTPTEGLAYTRPDNRGYQCDGIGTATGTELTVGGMIDDVPVVAFKSNAFHGNRTIEKLTILDTMTAISPYAFAGTRVSDITLSRMITTIGAWAFYGVHITDIVIPPLVSSIDDRAFADCPYLTTVYFKGTPATINSIAFNNCTALTAIYVPWEAGAVAGETWGALNATVHYNWQG